MTNIGGVNDQWTAVTNLIAFISGLCAAGIVLIAAAVSKFRD